MKDAVPTIEAKRIANRVACLIAALYLRDLLQVSPPLDIAEALAALALELERRAEVIL